MRGARSCGEDGLLQSFRSMRSRFPAMQHEEVIPWQQKTRYSYSTHPIGSLQR
jgi:hypothetical protein